MKIFLIILGTVFLSSGLFAQQKITVTGTVTTKDGRPLPGTTVYIKGTKTSVLVSEKGKFSVEASPGQYIFFSHVGYIPLVINIDSSGAGPLQIALQEDEQVLADIDIPTGYQHVEKYTATGSYETIDNKVFNRQTGTGILSRLDGTAGAILFDHRPGAEAPLQIRGLSSIDNSSLSPLIILDNFPYEGSISDINPNDVESVTILKDAAAAAIWGAKAANGVIVITTKKAKFDKPVQLSFNTDVIFSSKPDLLSLNTISTSDYIDVEQYLFNQGFYDFSLTNTYNYPPVSPVVQILADERAGLLTSSQASSKIDALRQLDVRNDFEKYLYRQGVTQQYSLALSGGSKTFSYRLSGGYDNTRSTLAGNQNDRLTFRSDNSFVPLKNLQLNVSVGYTRENGTNNSPGGYNDILISGYQSLYPYTRFVDDNGAPVWLDYMYSSAFTDTAGAGHLLNWKYNPLDELNNLDRTTTTNALVADIGLGYSFSKALKAEVKYHYQNNQLLSSAYYNINSFMARNFINEFTQLDGDNVTYIVPYGGILDEGHNRLNAYGARAQLDFNKTFHAAHSLAIIAGAEVRQSLSAGSSYRTYGYDDRLNHSAVDYVNYYPTFDNIAGYSFIPNNDGFSNRLDRYVSAYGNAIYSYKKKYILSGSFRKDASNLFGVKANQRGVPLWSVGGAWNASGENFYHLDWLPFLKLRATFGYTGNVSHSVSALTTLVFNPANSQPITNLPYANIQNHPNPDLRWEKVRTINLGVDFNSRNSRLSGSIEYFEKYSTDLLAAKSIDPTAGFSFLITNSANMQAKGWDIILNSINIKTASFNWQSAFNLSSVKNKLTKYLFPSPTDGIVNDGQLITLLVGYSPYEIVSYKWAGLDASGNPAGYLNGKPSTSYDSLMSNPLDQQVISGSAVPTCFGSFRNSITWKSLSLSFNIIYRLGYYFRKPSLSYYYLFYYGKAPADFANRWQQPGDEQKTDVPAMNYPLNSMSDNFYQYADVHVEPGGHVRLNDIRLGFEPPAHILRKTGFQSFEAFCYVSNLNILLWKANDAGIDPEFPSGLKTPLNVSFGIKTNF
ncbi:MAG TPA: SusC/RagA family TonB-linked outer membrane protein [Hanamia sp.]|nr:SusC/RagA family TonB-linked outer membrane protein [Hanamia sp.]